MQRLHQTIGLQRLVTQLITHPEASTALLQQLPCLRNPFDASSSHHAQSSGMNHAALSCRQFATPAAFKASVLNARPRSLALPKDTEVALEDAQIGGVTGFLLKLGGFYSKESSFIRGAKNLYGVIVQQSDDKDLKEALGLPDKFAATYSLLCIHVWMVLVRLRLEEADGKGLAQAMYEDFTDDVEMRVHAEGVKVRVQKWLKELEKMFYGSCESYEKALKGEGTLADALLRNVYGDDPMQRPHAFALAKYIERELACLNITPSSEVMSGRIHLSNFHSPGKPTARPTTLQTDVGQATFSPKSQ